MAFQKKSAAGIIPPQLVKKVLTDFFDYAFPAKHFVFGKMLLCPKSLEKSRLFCGGLLYHENCDPAAAGGR